MKPLAVNALRRLAAVLMTATGLAHIASLWFREISAQGLADGLWGCVYLFVALGLYGFSRFALFVALLVCATGIWQAMPGDQAALTEIGILQVVSQVLVATVCAGLLWRLRNLPSL